MHKFMAEDREQMLAIAVEKLRERAPDWSDERLLDGLPEVFDQIVSALRRAAGIADREPTAAEAGMNLGQRQQRDSDDVAMIAFSIGAISDVLGSSASGPV